MNSLSNARLYRVLIAPGEGYFPILETGRHVFLVASPLPVKVKVGDTAENDFLPGQGISYDAPDVFDRVEVRHEGTSPIWVEIWIGMVAFVDNRRDNIESSTEATGRAFTQIAANGLLLLAPDITRNRIRRKAIVVSNFDPSVTLLLSDTSNANSNRGNIIARIGPQEAITLPISEACRLRNDAGSAVSCAVGDIYWIR